MIDVEAPIELTEGPVVAQKNSNLFSSTLTLFANTIGITLLLMPKLYNTLGITLGLIVLAVTATVNFFTTYTLAQVSDSLSAKSYHEVAFKLLNFRKFFSFFYFSLMIGNIMCYHIFVLSSLLTTIESLMDKPIGPWTKVAIQFALTASTNLIVLPFLFSKNLYRIRRMTKYASFVIMIGAQVIIFAFFFPSVLGLETKPFPWTSYDLFNPEGLYVSFGFILLSFCNHLVVADVNNELAPKSPSSSKAICILNVLFSAVTYFCVSLCGYLTVWNHKDVSKMDNYLVFLVTHNEKSSKIIHLFSFLVLIGIAMANVTNYIPLIRYINFRKFAKSTEEGLEMNQIEEYDALHSAKQTIIAVFAFIWGVTAFVFLMNFNIDFVFNVVSAISAPMICIILPAFFGIRASKLQKMQISKPKFILLIGIIAFGAAVYVFSIFSLFKIIKFNE